MTYKTLMTHLKLGHDNKDLLRVSVDLAERLGAKVIGIVACQPTPMVYSDGYIPGSFYEQDGKEIDREIAVAATEFREAMQAHAVETEWRSATVYESIADYVARECRAADLIITSGLTHNPRDTARPEQPGDIVMQAGRPVLVVPRTARIPSADKMVVAWKNTRETRRAVGDAVPLLKLAKQVTVLEIAHQDEHERVTGQLREICAWLGTHEVSAEPRFIASGKGDDSYQLNAAIETLGAGVVVAGAYGHSRLREWVLGGVTRDLTIQASYCALLAH